MYTQPVEETTEPVKRKSIRGYIYKYLINKLLKNSAKNG